MNIFADVLGAVWTSRQKCTVLHNTLQSQITYTQVLGMCKLLGINLCYIHYKTKYNIAMHQLQDTTPLHYIWKLQSQFHIHMRWVRVTFRTKLYCVIHITSHNRSCPTAISFAVLTSPIYTACKCKVTGASSRLYRKDSSLKCSWISCGATQL